MGRKCLGNLCYSNTALGNLCYSNTALGNIKNHLEEAGKYKPIWMLCVKGCHPERRCLLVVLTSTPPLPPVLNTHEVTFTCEGLNQYFLKCSGLGFNSLNPPSLFDNVQK